MLKWRKDFFTRLKGHLHRAKGHYEDELTAAKEGDGATAPTANAAGEPVGDVATQSRKRLKVERGSEVKPEAAVPSTESDSPETTKPSLVEVLEGFRAPSRKPDKEPSSQAYASAEHPTLSTVTGEHDSLKDFAPALVAFTGKRQFQQLFDPPLKE